MNVYIRRLLLIITCYALIVTGVSNPIHTSAELNSLPDEQAIINWSDGDEQLQSILQSSLSVLEIDKEINKIQERLLQLQQYLLDSEAVLYERELEIEEHRKKADKVLRSYYMGDHQNIYLSLLEVENIQQFFYLLEIIEIIISKDQEALNDYINQYYSLEAMYSEYELEQQKLVEVEKQLAERRNQVLMLEQQIDEDLRNRPDAERVALLIKQLQSYWNHQGISYVETYFEKLAQAMNQLPAWLQKNDQYVTNKGFTYTISLPDDALNDYLRSYDPIFHNFEFIFSDDMITARGEKDNLEIEITGAYHLVNKPTNHIKFEMDQLLFNGFSLPDTTKAELLDRFDLNFYPQLLVKFIRATDVSITEDALTIVLKLSL